jgi:hypothetical protein
MPFLQIWLKSLNIMGLTTFDTEPKVHTGHIQSMEAASDHTIEAKIVSTDAAKGKYVFFGKCHYF